jgi:hypothetical protein
VWGIGESDTLQSEGVNGRNVLRNIKTDIR